MLADFRKHSVGLRSPSGAKSNVSWHQAACRCSLSNSIWHAPGLDFFSKLYMPSMQSRAPLRLPIQHFDLSFPCSAESSTVEQHAHSEDTKRSKVSERVTSSRCSASLQLRASALRSSVCQLVLAAWEVHASCADDQSRGHACLQPSSRKGV